MDAKSIYSEFKKQISTSLSPFEKLTKHWKIIKRILITLGFILLFRFGIMITIPGVTLGDESFGDAGGFLSILDMLGGGGLSRFSIFALGITPYITGSLIIQLLSSDVVPYLSKLNRQGEKGRIKLEKITRLTMLGFALIQGLALTLAMSNGGMIELNMANQWLQVIFITLILMAGSMVTIWIADQITMYGVGSGTSIIILTGILSKVPSNLVSTFEFWSGSASEIGTFIGVITFFGYYFLAFLMIYTITFFETSERRLPIQETGQGLNLLKDKQTYLPIKVNPAGVIPVIFASAVITLPPTIAQFFQESPGQIWVVDNFSLTSAFGLTLYALLVIAFTFFYASININPDETSENFQKSSTFIVGVAPGEQTRKYISRTVNSISCIGATELTLVAIFPYLLTFVGIPQAVTIGGTSMIIIVSVTVETWEQIKARVIAENTTHVDRATIKGFGKIRDTSTTILFD